MTDLQVVDHPDVEVPLDRLAAEKLDGRIRRMAESARGQLMKGAELVEEAKRGQVHQVLGYPSWTAYLADALGGQLQLTGESRREVVAFLAGEGMSVRAIATAAGMSKSTVDRDLAQVSHDGTPDADEAVPSGVPQRDTSTDPDAADVTITTLDGKTFTKRKRERKPRQTADPKTKASPKDKPTAPERRVQIPTAYREQVDGLRPLIAGLKVLKSDSRWDKATERFTHRDRAALDEFIVALQEFRTAMGELCNTTEVSPLADLPSTAS